MGFGNIRNVLSEKQCRCAVVENPTAAGEPGSAEHAVHIEKAVANGNGVLVETGHVVSANRGKGQIVVVVSSSVCLWGLFQPSYGSGGEKQPAAG